jgi:hypothetical protein
VDVQLTYVEDTNVVIEEVATHEKATNKLMYEAKFAPAASGQWRGVVAVDGPSGRGEPVDFEVAVLPTESVNWTVVAGSLIALGLLGLLVWSRRNPLSSRRGSGASNA